MKTAKELSELQTKQKQELKNKEMNDSYIYLGSITSNLEKNFKSFSSLDLCFSYVVRNELTEPFINISCTHGYRIYIELLNKKIYVLIKSFEEYKSVIKAAKNDSYNILLAWKDISKDPRYSGEIALAGQEGCLSAARK